MATKVQGRLITGARARLILNNQYVGYAKSVSVQELLEYQPVEVLGNIEVEEHVPVGYRVSMTVEMFRVFNETPKSQGFFPAVGDNQDTHLLNILTSEGLSAVIEDTKNNKAIATLERVKMTNNNWQVDSRGIMGNSGEFVAIRVKDESEI
jgi:hypothetical protein